MNPNDQQRADVTVYYDGDCPFCRWEVDMLERRQPGEVIQAVDITAPDFRLPEDVDGHEALMARFHARDSEGKLITGMDAFRALYRASGLGWLANLTALPVIRPLMDLAYWIFARVRVPLGRTINRIQALRSRT